MWHSLLLTTPLGPISELVPDSRIQLNKHVSSVAMTLFHLHIFVPYYLFSFQGSSSVDLH